MKNTLIQNELIELAVESGLITRPTEYDIKENPHALEIFEARCKRVTKFAELLQANSGNAVDEREIYARMRKKFDEEHAAIISQNKHLLETMANFEATRLKTPMAVWTQPKSFPESSVLCYLKLSNGKVIEGSCRHDWDGIGWFKGYPGMCNGFSMADPAVVGWMYKHETKLTLQELQAITKG